MYPVNGLNGSTLNEALSGSDFALVGTKLLFDATTCFSCKRNPWVFDSTNDTAWVVQDVMADANTGFIMNNMMRSGTSVLFTGYGYNYSTSSALPTNLYWYESTNDTIWQATFFTDSALTMNNKHGELANGDIVFKTISGSNEATYFRRPQLRQILHNLNHMCRNTELLPATLSRSLDCGNTLLHYCLISF